MATTVYVGSARSDENGKAHGGAAGDQTGKEVSTQKWYLHSKGWRVLRAKSYEIANKIAEAMQAACDNGHIGYDQYQRDSLLNVAAKVIPLYHPGKVVTACETDCSALVRVCTAYAVGRDVVGEVLNGARFSTANQVTQMLKTGLFEELKGDQYTTKSAYLRRGDILVTKTQGHTVVVLNSGDKATETPSEPAKETSSTTGKVNATSAAKHKDTALSGTYTVTASNLNMRHGAGTDKAVMVILPKGTKVKCYGYYNTLTNGDKWLYVQVTYKNVTYTGFCSEKYLSK